MNIQQLSITNDDQLLEVNYYIILNYITLRVFESIPCICILKMLNCIL